MEDPFVKLKYDKLIFELKFLEADLHYHDSILSKARPEFDAQCRAAIKERGIEDVFYGESAPAEQHAARQHTDNNPKKIKISKDTDILFKKIATMTHPDKLLHLDSDEKKAKEEMFLEATAAKEEDNLLKLHLIASTLGVEIPEISPQNFLMFESKIAEMKGEIDSKKSTWMWGWLLAPPEKRNTLMNDYISFMIQTVTKDNSQTTE